MSSTQIGSLVGVCAGTAWAYAGCAALSSRARTFALIVTTIAAVALTILVVRISPPSEGGFDGSAYGAAVFFESLAIGIGVPLLRRHDGAPRVPGYVAVIVGLHFIGLAIATQRNVFYGMSVATTLVGAITLFIRDWPLERRLAVTGFACAIVLFTGVAYSVL